MRGRSHTTTSDTINGFMLYRLRQELARGLEITWPDRTWWDRPVEFFTQILGVTPWSRQVDILEAVRDHDRVCVRSGHKVSKSNSLAGIALCFYASFDDARVVMSSTTARQRQLRTELLQKWRQAANR